MSKLNSRQLLTTPVLGLLLVLSAPLPATTQAPIASAGTATAADKSVPVKPATVTPAAAAPAAVAPGTAASAAPPAPMTGPQVIQLLDQTVGWYRTLGIQQQAATEPGDLLILYDNRQTASRVIGLAFDIARANVEMLAKQPALKDTGDAS